MPNNRERRRIAKALGLLKKRASLPYKKYVSELERSISAGKEIHRQKTELMYRSIEEQDDAIEHGKRESVLPTVNAKRESIGKLFNMPNETRSYNALSADVELAAWKKRFAQ